MEISKVTRNFQITIPKKIREKYNIKEGDIIKFIDCSTGIVLVLVK